MSVPEPIRVLFLCVHNSARSQMAEGLLRHLGGDRFEAHSAGSQPTDAVRPLAVRALAERGIAISRQRPKPQTDFLDHRLDYVITTCDEARESCPVFPGAVRQLHWRFDDPAAAQGNDAQRLAVYRRVAGEIEARIRQFVADTSRRAAGDPTEPMATHATMLPDSPGEPTERMVDVPGARLRSVRGGRGPAMVFLHGGPGMWDYLAPVAAGVADLATTYCYDQRGGGRSPGGPPYDLATAVADLDAVRAEWGVERWVVLGHSWGASLALAYALTHPARAGGLVYVSGTGVDPAWHAEYRAARLARLSPEERARWDHLRARLETATGEELAEVERAYAELSAAIDLADRSRVAALLGWLYADGFRINREVNRVLGDDARGVLETADTREHMRRLTLPTLVIHGALDPRPARYAAQVAELIPGAELLVMPKVGHYPRFEAPEPFGAALRGFLTSERVRGA